MEFKLYYVTYPDETEAESSALHLLERGLIACANLLPQMKSFYKWEGKIETSKECIQIYKIKPENSDIAVQEIESLHPYEAPAILELDTKSMNKSYSKWLFES